jgi:hypothetical protein
MVACPDARLSLTGTMLTELRRKIAAHVALIVTLLTLGRIKVNPSRRLHSHGRRSRPRRHLAASRPTR